MLLAVYRRLRLGDLETLVEDPPVPCEISI